MELIRRPEPLCPCSLRDSVEVELEAIMTRNKSRKSPITLIQVRVQGSDFHKLSNVEKMKGGAWTVEH
jgi:hypothetical protein